MNENQSKFLTAAKHYEELEEKMLQVRAELQEAMVVLGLDTYLQDPDTNLVYKILQPGGTFVHFKTIDYKRTAKEGERGGQVLSKKEAQEKGFSV